MVKASEFKNVCKAVNDRKLAELKKEIIEILKKQDEKDFKKATDYLNSQEEHFTHLEKSFSGKWIEKAGYGIGTVRVWKGKKYKKIAPDKWVRVFDKEGRGTNIAIGKLIAKVNKIDNVEDLMAFVMANKQRFVDENGVDLPVLDKLRAAVDARNDNVESKGKEYKLGDQLKLKNGKTVEYAGKGKDGKIRYTDRNGSTPITGTMDDSEVESVDNSKLSPKEQTENFVIDTLNNKKNSKSSEKYDDDKAYKEYQKLLMKENPTIADNERLGELVTEHYKHSKKEWIGGKGLKELNAAKDEDEVLSNGKTVKEVREQYGIESKKTSENKKTFKQEMNELYDAQDKAWEGFESGSEIKSTPENSKKFYDRVKKFVDDNNIKLSKKHYDEIEEMNGHSFNEALALAGAYGEDAKKKELARNKEYSQKYKGQILDLSMIDEFKESDDENKTYWIQDPYGDRLTNEDAKNWIKENYSKIEEIKNSDVPRKDMQIRKLKYEILDLKDRLNPEDRKEIESEVEKHQNRSEKVGVISFNELQPIATNKSVGENEVQLPYSKDLADEIDSLKNCVVSKNDPRETFKHIFYKDGKLVTTDARRMKFVEVGKLEGIPDSSYVDISTDKSGINIKKIDFNAQFPNYSKVIPENLNQSATLDTKLVKDKIKEMQKDGAISKKGLNIVQLEFRDGKVFIDDSPIGEAKDIKMKYGEGWGPANEETNFMAINADYLVNALSGKKSVLQIGERADKAVVINTGSSSNILMPMSGSDKKMDYGKGRQAKKEDDEYKANAKQKAQDALNSIVDTQKDSMNNEWVQSLINKVNNKEMENHKTIIEHAYKALKDAEKMIEKPTKKWTSSLANNKYGYSLLAAVRKNPEFKTALENMAMEYGLIKKSLFDDFIVDVFEADDEEEIEDELYEGETEYNDYSAVQPELFNSTEMKVREALDRINNQVL